MSTPVELPRSWARVRHCTLGAAAGQLALSAAVAVLACVAVPARLPSLQLAGVPLLTAAGVASGVGWALVSAAVARWLGRRAPYSASVGAATAAAIFAVNALLCLYAGDRPGAAVAAAVAAAAAQLAFVVWFADDLAPSRRPGRASDGRAHRSAPRRARRPRHAAVRTARPVRTG